MAGYFGWNAMGLSNVLGEPFSKRGCLTAVLTFLIGIGGLMWMGDKNSKDMAAHMSKKDSGMEKKIEFEFPKSIIEYLDLNENGRYDHYRNINEWSDGKRDIWSVEKLSGDYTEKNIRENHAPQANEIRFLNK
ncbi:MAG: hypothetical protein ABH840_03435 [Nanoarchaeota archaeon]